MTPITSLVYLDITSQSPNVWIRPLAGSCKKEAHAYTHTHLERDKRTLRGSSVQQSKPARIQYLIPAFSCLLCMWYSVIPRLKSPETNCFGDIHGICQSEKQGGKNCVQQLSGFLVLRGTETPFDRRRKFRNTLEVVNHTWKICFKCQLKNSPSFSSRGPFVKQINHLWELLINNRPLGYCTFEWIS